MTAVRLLKPVRHNGRWMQPDELIPGLTEDEAKRLETLGYGAIDEDVLPDVGGSNTPPKTKPELIAELNRLGVALSGNENKAVLTALLEQAMSDTGGGGE